MDAAAAHRVVLWAEQVLSTISVKDLLIPLFLFTSLEALNYTMDLDEEDQHETGSDQPQSIEHTEQHDNIHPDMVSE